MHRYCGGPAGGTPGQGLFLDENFVIITHPPEGERQGGATMLHSGAHKRRVRTQFRYHDGEFRCGMLSLIVALTEIGEGDGATIVRPFRSLPSAPVDERARLRRLCQAATNRTWPTRR